jgi:tetratricopeptide (TPR) repeat protein
MSSSNESHYQELGMICAEVAEIVAETGDFEQADMILNALETANIFTAEKATLGRMYMRMLGKKTDLALAYGEQAYGENPRLHKVAYLLGQLYELAEQPQVALQWFERSLLATADADWRPHALEQYARLGAQRQASLRTMDVTSGSIRV